jgi:hypothetical protein
MHNIDDYNNRQSLMPIIVTLLLDVYSNSRMTLDVRLKAIEVR